MGYFSTDGCTIGAFVVSDAQKKVINQVTNGVAFVNPIENNIDGVSSSVNGISASIGSATAPAIFAGITGALATLKTNINSLVSHAERLSGVSLSAAGPSGEPGINGLIGTAKSYNSICESMTGGTEDNLDFVGLSYLIIVVCFLSEYQLCELPSFHPYKQGSCCQ